MKKTMAILFIVLVTAALIVIAGDCARAAGKTPMIGGIGIGLGVKGPHKNEIVSIGYGGVQIKAVDTTAGSEAALWTVFQYVGVENGPSANGGKIIFQNKIKRTPVHMLFDVGALFDFAVNGDSTLTTAMTLGGGVFIETTRYIGLTLYVDGFDAGPEWNVVGRAAINFDLDEIFFGL